MCLWQNRKLKFPMFLPRVLNACQQLFGTYYPSLFLFPMSEPLNHCCSGKILPLMLLLEHQADPTWRTGSFWNFSLNFWGLVLEVTQFQHFLIHPCLKSHYWCSSKISFSSPSRGRKHLDCIIPRPQTLFRVIPSLCLCPPRRNYLTGQQDFQHC